MTTVIGLKSGREFLVRDKCYRFLQTDGSVTHVFISSDDKRLITVPPHGSIEFFDEPKTEQAVQSLNTVVSTEATDVIQEVDPNVV